MIGSTRSNFYGYMLLLCMLTLMLALAWPASAARRSDTRLAGDPGAMPSRRGGPGRKSTRWHRRDATSTIRQWIRQYRSASRSDASRHQ